MDSSMLVVVASGIIAAVAMLRWPFIALLAWYAFIAAAIVAVRLGL